MAVALLAHEANFNRKKTKMSLSSKPKQLETSRLILRAWDESDAEELYRYAKDERVGPAAAWPVHTSVENSLEIIRTVLAADETYAVVLKETGLPVGSIGLLRGNVSDLGIKDDEAEVGYWIGVPYWGQGLIPEATKEIMRHAFEDLGLKKLWCGSYEVNSKSRRVQEKCGFRYSHTLENVERPLLGDTQSEYITSITREEWLAEQ